MGSSTSAGRQIRSIQNGSAGTCNMYGRLSDKIFPAKFPYGVKCNKSRGCHEVKIKVKYAVIKEETAVVGCAKGIVHAQQNSKTKKLTVCPTGFVLRNDTVPIAELSKDGNQLYKKQKKVVFCVPKN